MLAAFTRLPKLPLLTLAAALGVGAYIAGPATNPPIKRPKPNRKPHERRHDIRQSRDRRREPPRERMEDLLHVDPLELEIGYRLITLAEPTRGGDLLDRLRTIRHEWPATSA